MYTKTVRFTRDVKEQEPDGEGYILVPPLEKNSVLGVRCGQCFSTFDYGRSYMLNCIDPKCPMHQVNLEGKTNE